jgi:hypothetical protein
MADPEGTLRHDWSGPSLTAESVIDAFELFHLFIKFGNILQTLIFPTRNRKRQKTCSRVCGDIPEAKTKRHTPFKFD